MNVETKVSATTTATALAAVATAILGGLGVTIDPAVALAITTFLVAAVGWLAPHTSRPDLGDPPKGRHHADAGYSAVELAVVVLAVLAAVWLILEISAALP